MYVYVVTCLNDIAETDLDLESYLYDWTYSCRQKKCVRLKKRMIETKNADKKVMCLCVCMLFYKIRIIIIKKKWN